jgi:hypothetical protein
MDIIQDVIKVFSLKKGRKPAGLYKGNIVWEHFVKGKKYFSQLIK